MSLGQEEVGIFSPLLAQPLLPPGPPPPWPPQPLPHPLIPLRVRRAGRAFPLYYLWALN